jgi:predicted TIM-barrel fold metal-dependent hydrolase
MTIVSEGIISADSHVTEPADLWSNYIDPAYRDRAPHIERREETDVVVCDTASMVMSIGLLHGARYAWGESPNPKGRYDDIPTTGWDAAARIPEIEADGVHSEFVYPTVAMYFWSIEDVAFGEACFRAYNDWLVDFCRPLSARFKGCGMVMLEDVDRGMAELRRVKEMGLSGAMIAVNPAGTKPYHDPVYEPFWAAAEETGLPVSLHVSTDRRRDLGDDPTVKLLHYTAVHRVLVSMVYAGIFDRYPGLRVVSAENDAGWAGNIIERMDYFYAGSRWKTIRTGDAPIKRLPSEYWRDNVSYTFMRDRTAMLAREVIGVDNLMWGSDYPHGDSTYPNSQDTLAEIMAGVPEEDQRKVLRDNAARMYGF